MQAEAADRRPAAGKKATAPSNQYEEDCAARIAQHKQIMAALGLVQVGESPLEDQAQDEVKSLNACRQFAFLGFASRCIARHSALLSILYGRGMTKSQAKTSSSCGTLTKCACKAFRFSCI